MEISIPNECNSITWHSGDSVKITVDPHQWIQIKPDYNGLDFNQEQKAIHFYCKIIQDPEFLPNAESRLAEWIREIETYGQENYPRHEIEVLRRLRRIFQV